VGPRPRPPPLQDTVAELAALATRARTALIQVQQERKPD
jgi:hypothetical protein